MSDEKPVLTIQEEEKPKTPAQLQQDLIVKAAQLEKDLDNLAAQYGANILAAVSFDIENNTGVFYSGEQNVIIELGLAKVIENKFNKTAFN